jgi:hypothetical protein
VRGSYEYHPTLRSFGSVYVTPHGMSLFKPRDDTAIKLGVLMLTLPSEDGFLLVFSAASFNFRHSLFLMGETG